MAKSVWKPGNMLYPAPAVMVSCGDQPDNYNIITISWAANICTDPAMTSISIRPGRHSYEIIKRTREFVINLTTEKLAYATDFCGVKSGRSVNKFERMKLTPRPGKNIKAPLIVESPVNIECKVTEIKKLGSHDLFLAKVLCVHADQQYLNKKGSFHLRRAQPIAYSRGHYYSLGKYLGHFGFSVKKKPGRR